ncbi:MAG: sel1 repeat family protein [Trueperaceae bacterium]|nr:MAG: sel1 repeat family protein [Trueperaceae bacterium]
MVRDHVVELMSPVDHDVFPSATVQVALELGIPVEKLAQLLKKGPGIVTKPTRKEKAEKVAQVMREAGLDVQAVSVQLGSLLLVSEPVVGEMMAQAEPIRLKDTMDQSLPGGQPLNVYAQSGASASYGDEPSTSGPEGEPSIQADLGVSASTAEVRAPEYGRSSRRVEQRVRALHEMTSPRRQAEPVRRRWLLPALMGTLLVAVVLSVPLLVPGVWQDLRTSREPLPSFDEGVAAFLQEDYRAAAEVWRSLAEAGHQQAQFRLAELHRQQLIDPAEAAEATRWYRAAAEQGHADSQFMLGVAYFDGEGVGQDYLNAAKWFRQAAEQDHAEAQFNYGIMLIYGQGVPQDYIEATEWLESSAQLGVVEAQAFLDSLRDIEGEPAPGAAE